MRACFFVRTKDRGAFDVVEFYKNDIQILRDLGFEVIIATGLREVPGNADLYFTWWWGSGVLSLLRSLPMHRPNIFTGALQLDPIVGWWQELGVARRLVVRACLKLASANLAICDHEMVYLQRLGARAPRRVYPAINLGLYSPGTTPLRDREKLVVTVSDLTRENVYRKRIITFIRAIPRVLQRHPDARFVVVGRHESGYDDLRQLADALGVSGSVIFPGRIAVQDKIKLFHSARVFAQPTLYEGFGASIAEAMATELPVITSPRGSVPEVVGDCGLMVDPDDADGLADSISNLIDNPDDSTHLAVRGRARVEKLFSYARRRAEIARVIADVGVAYSHSTSV